MNPGIGVIKLNSIQPHVINFKIQSSEFCLRLFVVKHLFGAAAQMVDFQVDVHALVEDQLEFEDGFGAVLYGEEHAFFGPGFDVNLPKVVLGHVILHDPSPCPPFRILHLAKPHNQLPKIHHILEPFDDPITP